MSKDRLRARTQKKNTLSARRPGVNAKSTSAKDPLTKKLAAAAAKRRAPVRKKPRVLHRKQRAVARNTSESNGNGQRIEASKFDIGVATKNLSTALPRELPNGYGRDRIVLMVRDPFWLHTYWELTATSVQRAEVALGQDWHSAKPIIRVLDVTSEDISGSSEAVVRDIDIHGGCNNWYIDVQNPPRSYRVDIGYLTKQGRFYVLSRSNVVTTPRAGISDKIDENWADVQKNYEKIYAMSSGFDPTASSLELKQLFEERLRRPMGSPAITSFGSGAFPGSRRRNFWFEIDAELIVYGATEPNAKVTLQGEPIRLRPDGTFTVRYSLPDSRQIIPAVAASADGVEERTIVLAVERNTKALEPMLHDGSCEQ
jgi:hypothetical protein